MANEWTVKMHINDIFDEEITRITASMLPKNFSADARTTRAVQEQIAALIDELGEESATSQGLKKVITSAEKLRTNPKHAVYLLKDYRAKEGKGEIIGLLKVGRKHLFLFDSKETVHEVEPLCVLDFYIVHNRQRMGFGRMLFDFVLNELEVTASQMAIDGPSDKMEKFLSRNFGVEKLIRQNNNFAIAPNFFDRSDYEISNCGRDVSDEPAAAVGRFAAPRPNSDIANVIHGAAAGQEDAARCSPSLEVAAALVPAIVELDPEVAAVQPDVAAPEPNVDSLEPDVAAPNRDVATPESDFESLVSDVDSEPEVAALRLEDAAPEPEVAATEPEVTAPNAEALPEVSARRTAGGTCPITGRTYMGFTPMELLTTDDEDSTPEYDDDAYERCYFDMDQPAYEWRDERRARGYVSNDDEQGVQPAPSAPPAEFEEPEEPAEFEEPEEPADLR